MSFLGLLYQITTNWGLKQQKCLLSQCWRPEVPDHWVGWVGSQSPLGLRGRLRSLSLFLASGAAGNPWPSLSCDHITPIPASVFPQPSSRCTSVSNLSLIRTSVIGFRTHSDPGWSHLESLNFTSARPSFQIRSRAQVLGVRLWTCLFTGRRGCHPSTHYTCQKLKIP